MHRPKYRLTRELADAIRRRGNLTQQAAPVGLTQAALSTFLNGGTFGPRVRQRIVALGQAAGVSESHCTELVQIPSERKVTAALTRLREAVS